MRRAATATATRAGAIGLMALSVTALSAGAADAQVTGPTHGVHAADCHRGLEALPFTSPRPRVLADGAAAAKLVIDCAEVGGVKRLELSPLPQTAWIPLAPRAARVPGLSAVRLEQSARARARVRREAAGRERFDLVVVAPERAADDDSTLAVLLPRVRSETVEGLGELLDALSSEGALVGLLDDEPSALRFALTAMQSLRARGVARPSARVVVQRARHRHVVSISPEPIAMDTLLALHERDRRRREGEGRGEVAGSAAVEPVLIHTPVAVFPNPFAELLAAHGGPSARERPPAYVFDVAPVHDDRPLFFERTRRDRPDTWTSRGAYERALVQLVAALALGLVGFWLAQRALARAAPRAGLGLGAPASLLGLTHGALLAWSVQATSRLLADERAGVAVALLGVVAGGALSLWLAHGTAAPRRPLLAGAAAACLALTAPTAWWWRELPVLPLDQARWSGAAVCALAAAAATAPLGLLAHATAGVQSHARVIMAACHAGALVLSVPVVYATVLFGDYRAVGITLAVTGALGAVLTARSHTRSLC